MRITSEKTSTNINNSCGKEIINLKISIVSSIYKSEYYIEEFYRRMCLSVRKISKNYELIFVNDGSPDSSFELLKKLQIADNNIIIVDLSRNYGHHRAMLVGLSYATGDNVYLIDCDLEEEPEWIIPFFEQLVLSNADSVFGVQKSRKGNFLERISGFVFYKLIDWVSSFKLTPNPVTARLMTRRFVNALLQHHQKDIYLMGLCEFIGFKQVIIPVEKHFRKITSYNLRKRISLAVQVITSFSQLPLVISFYIGLFISILAGIAVLLMLYRSIFHGFTVLGWPSLIISIWFLGGLNIFCIGLVGIYLARVFIEVKNQPTAIVREVYRSKEF